ncbi:MAG: potassium channel family protein [Pseudomonadota bacterium]
MTGAQPLLGVAWTLLTMGFAVIFIIVMSETMPRMLRPTRSWNPPLRDAFVLFICVLWLLLGVFVIVALWALLFVLRGEFSDWDTSLYFSVVSVTTVGYGDITLAPGSRILAGFAAADGFLIFGLYTAALYEAITKLREERHRVES